MMATLLLRVGPPLLGFGGELGAFVFLLGELRRRRAVGARNSRHGEHDRDARNSDSDQPNPPWGYRVGLAEILRHASQVGTDQNGTGMSPVRTEGRGLVDASSAAPRKVGATRWRPPPNRGLDLVVRLRYRLATRRWPGVARHPPRLGCAGRSMLSFWAGPTGLTGMRALRAWRRHPSTRFPITWSSRTWRVPAMRAAGHQIAELQTVSARPQPDAGRARVQGSSRVPQAERGSEERARDRRTVEACSAPHRD